MTRRGGRARSPYGILRHRQCFRWEVEVLGVAIQGIRV
jgi:hypothetical protein